MRRLATAGAIAALALIGTAQAVGYDEWVPGVVAERAEAHGVSPNLLVAVASCETGGRFDPNLTGDYGRSVGLFMLHERGLRPLFYRMGYDDVWSAWQQADFAAWAFSEGMAGNWSCYWVVVQRGA